MSETQLDLAWDARAHSSTVAFTDLVSDADFIKGADLKAKEDLVGIPFIITLARFNQGKGKSDFVSLEAVTADDQAIVLNDGSTGIRRQVVAYLTAKGLIDPGRGDEGGQDSRYDKPAAAWVKGGDQSAEGFPVKLVASRGLRDSAYDYQGEIVHTFYLA
jgi:hypothetical protein